METKPIPPVFNAEQQKLPRCAFIDFEKTPPQFLPSIVLQQFLLSRGIKLGSSKLTKRDEIVKICSTVIAQGNLRTIIPNELIIQNTESGHYIDIHRFRSMDDSTSIEWMKKLDLIFAVLRSDCIAPITPAVMNPLVNNRPSACQRVMRLISSGNYDLNSMKLSNCILSIHGNVEVSVLCITVTPSMKSNEYICTAVFNKVSGQFIPPPASSCECPAGSFLCCHLIGLLTLICQIQTLKELSEEEFLKVFPEPIKSVTSLCIPLELVVRKRKRSL